MAVKERIHQGIDYLDTLFLIAACCGVLFMLGAIVWIVFDLIF